MEIFLLLSSLLVGLIVYFLIRAFYKDKFTRLIDEIPGPLKLPLIGTAHSLLFIPKEDFFRRAKYRLGRFGPIIRTWMGSKPVVHFTTPESIELILSNTTHITKGELYSFTQPWLGEGLLTSTGEKWHKHRKLITPTFHFKILENFMDVFVEKSRTLIDKLNPKANGEVLDLYPLITRCTLDIICETAMGVQINAMDSKENRYVDSVYGISRNIVQRFLTPWFQNDYVFYKSKLGKKFLEYLNVLHGFTRTVIKERKEKANAPETGASDEFGIKKRKAFLDLFLEMSRSDPPSFTDDEIREQVDTFMFEGHDTTTAGISWSLFLLGNHQDIQEEVYKEIETVFDGRDGDLTINDLNELKLLERCIKEALRIYPSVPTIGRTAAEDIKFDKYTVPAGCPVNIQIFLLHRNDELYPDPEKFDPDRFLPENSNRRHPYAYIPFSAGPRNCIGQKFAMYEEKTVLAYILKNFKVKSMQTQENVIPMMELVLRPRDGLLVTLEKRNRSKV